MKVTKSIKMRALVFAISISLILTGGMLYYLNLKSVPKDNLTKVVIAVTNISGNTTITNNQIKETMLPKDMIVKSYVSDKAQVVGKIAKENIYEGEQIVAERLTEKAGKDGLTSSVPKGYRAVTIAADSVSGVAGFIKKGDLVDIMFYLKPPFSEKEEVKTLFQSVEVLTVGTEGKENADVNIITFSMKPEDAEKLFIANETGKLKLALRYFEDKEPQTTPVIDVTSLK